jgi:hypothetical protein
VIDRVTDNRVAQHGSLLFQDYHLRSAAAEASLIRFRQFADTAEPNVKVLAFPMLPAAPVSFRGHVVEGLDNIYQRDSSNCEELNKLHIPCRLQVGWPIIIDEQECIRK